MKTVQFLLALLCVVHDLYRSIKLPECIFMFLCPICNAVLLYGITTLLIYFPALNIGSFEYPLLCFDNVQVQAKHINHTLTFCIVASFASVQFYCVHPAGLDGRPGQSRGDSGHWCYKQTRLYRPGTQEARTL